MYDNYTLHTESKLPKILQIQIFVITGRLELCIA